MSIEKEKQANTNEVFGGTSFCVKGGRVMLINEDGDQLSVSMADMVNWMWNSEILSDAAAEYCVNTAVDLLGSPIAFGDL